MRHFFFFNEGYNIFLLVIFLQLRITVIFYEKKNVHLNLSFYLQRMKLLN